MKLTKRQLHDYKDIDWPELMLIRAGHYIWAMHKRERRANPRQDEQELPSWHALQTIWEAKKAYRAERKAKEAPYVASLQARMARIHATAKNQIEGKGKER